MSAPRHGGCLCGAVRYELDWPPMALVTCSCSNCQKQSGSALSVVAFASRDALRLSGELATYVDHGDSGNEVWRRFCPSCGSPVITDTPDAETQGIIFIKAGTLDQTRDLEPTTHMWTQSAQRWLVLPDHHEKIDKQ